MRNGQHSTLGMRAPQKLEQHICTEDVLAAVESLYDDELKPYGRILRKRLEERGALQYRCDVGTDIQNIKDVCEACPLLSVQLEEGGEWSATLKGRTPCFVDVYSPNDYYSNDVWQQMADYFDSFQDPVDGLPGGRYSCAQALMARSLPFLESRSLGQVSHIVQLAISQKKILGHSNGTLVPYKHSQSMLKDRCAEHQKPCMNPKRRSKRLATWESVRSAMQQILVPCVAVSDSIALSNLKRLFRDKFHQELSETALGHRKLSDLLQDKRLSDICSVRLQGNAYIVVPKLNKTHDAQSTPEYDGEATGEAHSRKDGGRALQGNDELGVQLSVESVTGPDGNSQPQGHGKEDYEYVVQNTFITVTPVHSAKSPCHKRTRSLPMDMESPTKSAGESNHQALCCLTPLLFGVLESSVSSTDSAGSPVSVYSRRDAEHQLVSNPTDTDCNSNVMLSQDDMVPEENVDWKEDHKQVPGLEEATIGLPGSEVPMVASRNNSRAPEATWSHVPRSGTTSCNSPI